MENRTYLRSLARRRAIEVPDYSLMLECKYCGDPVDSDTASEGKASTRLLEVSPLWLQRWGRCLWDFDGQASLLIVHRVGRP